MNNFDVKKCSWFLAMCKTQILRYVACGTCTSTGYRVCRPCNVRSIIHVSMYVRLVRYTATLEATISWGITTDIRLKSMMKLDFHEI